MDACLYPYTISVVLDALHLIKNIAGVRLLIHIEWIKLIINTK